jgi:hypothetical protein
MPWGLQHGHGSPIAGIGTSGTGFDTCQGDPMPNRLFAGDCNTGRPPRLHVAIPPEQGEGTDSADLPEGDGSTTSGAESRREGRGSPKRARYEWEHMVPTGSGFRVSFTFRTHKDDQ